MLALNSSAVLLPADTSRPAYVAFSLSYITAALCSFVMYVSMAALPLQVLTWSLMPFSMSPDMHNDLSIQTSTALSIARRHRIVVVQIL